MPTLAGKGGAKKWRVSCQTADWNPESSDYAELAMNWALQTAASSLHTDTIWHTRTEKVTLHKQTRPLTLHDNAQATPSAAGRAAAFRAGEGEDMTIRLVECGFMKLGTYKRFWRTCSVNLQDRGQNCRRIAGIYQPTRRHISSHRILPQNHATL